MLKKKRNLSKTIIVTIILSKLSADQIEHNN